MGIINQVRKLPRNMIGIIALIVCTFAIAAVIFLNPAEKPPEVVTACNLERIVELNHLNMYETVYNGVAEVLSGDEGKERTVCYVSYEATVKAGFDFSSLAAEYDFDNKIVTVILPPVELGEPNVDTESLEFIFVKDRYNDENMYVPALTACEKDVEGEIKTNSMILKFAKENAEKMIHAMFDPILAQLEEPYTLIVK